MNDARCVIGEKPHAADVGYLCDNHFTRLGAMLRDIEDQAALLDAQPSMAQRSDRGGGLASHRAPARLDILVHNDPRHGTGMSEDAEDALAAGSTLSILGVLHAWARVVREDRALAQPATVTISGERDLLTRQIPWLAEQSWIDEAFAELRDLVAQLRRQNGTNALRKKPVGVCPTLFEDGECGGRLWANDQRGEVTCDLCGRVFEPAELRHLGMMLVNQGYVEVFRAEWFTGVPAGTIRRWASEGRCTSQKDGKKLLVQIAEVEQLRDRRKRRMGVAS